MDHAHGWTGCLQRLDGPVPVVVVPCAEGISAGMQLAPKRVVDHHTHVAACGYKGVHRCVCGCGLPRAKLGLQRRVFPEVCAQGDEIHLRSLSPQSISPLQCLQHIWRNQVVLFQKQDARALRDHPAELATEHKVQFPPPVMLDGGEGSLPEMSVLVWVPHTAVSLYRVSGAITWVRAREAFWVKLTGEWEEYRQHLAELHALDDLHDLFQVHVTADDEQGRFDAPDVTQRVQEALQSIGSGVHLHHDHNLNIPGGKPCTVEDVLLLIERACPCSQFIRGQLLRSWYPCIECTSLPCLPSSMRGSTFSAWGVPPGSWRGLHQ
mmetsp:Transcript_8358/g.21398  ORF Transcript_8358/g.21398 Transcript_8358/m.21398 type:complete len:322 (-) Transcript_8358:134-1099(-)